MPQHFCIDPQDPYAEREVLVDFERAGSEFYLTAAVNVDGDDILADLIDTQCRDLHLELAEADCAVLNFGRSPCDHAADQQAVSH